MVKKSGETSVGKWVGVGIFGAALAATPFVLQQAAAAPQENAIEANTSGRIGPQEHFVADLREAEINKYAPLIVDYVNFKAAEDFANKQRAVAELILAKQAEEAAAAQAQVDQARQQVQQVYSNSSPGDFLSCVRNRESGGNYGIYNAGGSGAAGAYQFLPGTWNSIAADSGRGDLVGVDPAQASPADQDAMAQALYDQQGAAPWAGGSYEC